MPLPADRSAIPTPPSSGRSWTTPAFEVAVQDPTAAGDAFCGALVAALAAGKTLSDAVVWGCAGGALAKHDLKPNMDKAYAMERGELPEKAA